jgi:CheY-like chemotaxis protein
VKVLVADDSRVMRQIVRRELRRAGLSGHTVVEAANGLEAWELTRSEQVDLVLSDWNMPVLDGMGLLRRLRAAGDPVRFGFVTSEGSVEMRRRALAAGADFLIAKPFAADDFRVAVEPPERDESRSRPSALPSNKAVRDVLDALLGRTVTVAPGAALEVGRADPAVVAVFVDDSLRTVAVAVADLALATFAGAALALVPPARAAATLESRFLPEQLRENTAEVFNVLSTLFNVPGAPHVRLFATYAPDERLPGDVDLIVHTLGRRLDLDLELAGYGRGRLAFVLADG